MSNKALISIKVSAHKGMGVLTALIKKISEEFKIVNCSSVYSVYSVEKDIEKIRDLFVGDGMGGISTVCEIETDLTTQNVAKKLIEIEQEFKRGKNNISSQIIYLAHGEEIVMQPGLSLPHPEMHLRPEEIILAAEVAPNFIHPVLNESLLNLSRRFSNDNWGEFYAQNTALLDF